MDHRGRANGAASASTTVHATMQPIAASRINFCIIPPWDNSESFESMIAASTAATARSLLRFSARTNRGDKSDLHTAQNKGGATVPQPPKQVISLLSTRHPTPP